MTSAVLCLVLLCQSPATRPPAKPQGATPAVSVWTDSQTRTLLRTHKKGLQANRRKASMKQRMEAVEALAKGRNKLLVKPLAHVTRHDPAVTIQCSAATALGYQPAKQARTAILALLRSERMEKQPQVLANLVDALGRAGFKPSDWPMLEKLFGREFHKNRVRLQKNIIRLAKSNMVKASLDLLCTHLDEPIPEDVDILANPPKEYWEQRWKAWQVWREDVKGALLAITGHRFSTGKEARVWIRKNAHKIGKKKRKTNR